jgi:hypothetical protein
VKAVCALGSFPSGQWEIVLQAWSEDLDAASTSLWCGAEYVVMDP